MRPSSPGARGCRAVQMHVLHNGTQVCGATVVGTEAMTGEGTPPEGCPTMAVLQGIVRL